jgi:hypothetical protein
MTIANDIDLPAIAHLVLENASWDASRVSEVGPVAAGVITPHVWRFV